MSLARFFEENRRALMIGGLAAAAVVVIGTGVALLMSRGSDRTEAVEEVCVWRRALGLKFNVIFCTGSAFV